VHRHVVIIAERCINKLRCINKVTIMANVCINNLRVQPVGMVKLFDLVSGPVIVLCMYVVGLEQLTVILPCQWSLVIVICLCFAGLEQIFDLVIAVQ
jgi:hypothetical protein